MVCKGGIVAPVRFLKANNETLLFAPGGTFADADWGWTVACGGCCLLLLVDVIIFADSFNDGNRLEATTDVLLNFRSKMKWAMGQCASTTGVCGDMYVSVFCTNTFA